jgi:hypothetical protein
MSDERSAAKIRDAGLAAMVGTFTYHDIQAAMARAVGPSDRIYRAADRLLQAERKAGRIRTTPGNKRKWEQVPTPTGDTQHD